MRRVHTTSPNHAAKTERDTLLALVFGRFRFVVTEIHIVTTLVKKRGETAAAAFGGIAEIEVPRQLMTRSGHACHPLRGFDFRGRESGMSDRHSCALRPGRSFNFGAEFLRERLDYAGSEPGFWLGKDAVRPANSIVGD